MAEERADSDRALFPLTQGVEIVAGSRRGVKGKTGDRSAQPFLQNRTATGIIVLRWNKIRTNYLFACIYRRWYPDVLYLASHPDRDLRTWRSCT